MQSLSNREMEEKHNLPQPYVVFDCFWLQTFTVYLQHMKKKKHWKFKLLMSLFSFDYSKPVEEACFKTWGLFGDVSWSSMLLAISVQQVSTVSAL